MSDKRNNQESSENKPGNEALLVTDHSSLVTVLEVTDVIDLHTFAPRDIPAVVETYLEEVREGAPDGADHSWEGERRAAHPRAGGASPDTVRGILSRRADGSRRLGRNHRLVYTSEGNGAMTSAFPQGTSLEYCFPNPSIHANCAKEV